MSNIPQSYQHELHSLNLEILDFAKQYNNIVADSLLENPHITRLIQAFSLLSSNLNLVLEESFSQFISSLFDILYPHYNNHIPSIAIIALKLNQKHESSIDIPKGKLLEMESSTSCTFQTCYDTQISPLQISQASCYSPYEGTSSKGIDNIESVLNIQCTTLDKLSFVKLGLKKIRFLIQGVDKEEYAIYQNIMNNLVAVTISSPNHNTPITLGNNCVKQVGFNEEENILPYPPNSFLGYRLITEFFAFSEKFLFFDLMLNEVDLTEFNNSMEICCHLNTKDLIGRISKDNFVLNAVPIINLFKAESDPVEIKTKVFDYPLIIDNKNKDNHEVYAINQVKVNVDNQETTARKLFDFNYSKDHNKNDLWYLAKKRNLLNSGLQQEVQYISLINNQRNIFTDTTLPKYFYVDAICSNGHLPHILYPTNKASFRFFENTMPIAKIECITSPTPRRKIGKDKDQKWSLIAHLSLNYLNIVNNSNGKELLQEIVSMYIIDDNKLHNLLLKNISDVKVLDKITRTRSSSNIQFYKGNLIEIYFNNDHLPAGLAYLFLNILEYFLAMYCSINSFIQLIGKTNRGDIIYSGAPRNGNKCLI